MADDNDDWLSAAADDTPFEPEPAPIETGADIAAPTKTRPPRLPSISDENIVWARPPPQKFPREKTRVFTHWARPTFLQYDYIYQYRHNYYDDWINYLDQKLRGMDVTAPLPQTWAERVLRTYTRNTYPDSITWKLPRLQTPEKALLHTAHWANTWHTQHSKDYFNRKYKEILF